MENINDFAKALSTAFSDDLFDGIVNFVKNIFGAFEDLLSSTEGSSESTEPSPK